MIAAIPPHADVVQTDQPGRRGGWVHAWICSACGDVPGATQSENRQMVTMDAALHMADVHPAPKLPWQYLVVSG